MCSTSFNARVYAFVIGCPMCAFRGFNLKARLVDCMKIVKNRYVISNTSPYLKEDLRFGVNFRFRYRSMWMSRVDVLFSGFPWRKTSTAVPRGQRPAIDLLSGTVESVPWHLRFLILSIIQCFFIGESFSRWSVRDCVDSHCIRLHDCAISWQCHNHQQRQHRKWDMAATFPAVSKASLQCRCN